MGWIDIRDGNQLKERLRRGETVLGCFQRVPAPQVTEVCAAAGFDFVVVDTEHTPVSTERVADLVRAAEAAGIPALVRVGSHDPAAIAPLLEAGPAGLHVPQVPSAAAAAAVVRATRYPPHGSRGLASPRQAGYGTRMSLAEYVRASEEAVLLVVQVENLAALEEVEAIAAVPGVDALFVGLTDLSQDFGVPGEYGHPKLREAVDRVLRAGEAQGKPVGVPVSGPAMAEEYRARGARYLAANDIRLLLESSQALVERLRAHP